MPNLLTPYTLYFQFDAGTCDTTDAFAESGPHKPCELQLVGADLVPEDDKGVQRLLLGALLLPQLLGLSSADASAGRRLAASAKVRQTFARNSRFFESVAHMECVRTVECCEQLSRTDICRPALRPGSMEMGQSCLTMSLCLSRTQALAPALTLDLNYSYPTSNAPY